MRPNLIDADDFLRVLQDSGVGQSSRLSGRFGRAPSGSRPFGPYAAIPSPTEELFSKRSPEDRWHLELAPWAPKARMTEAERRADEARYVLGREKRDREEGWGGHHLLSYDAPKDLFRFSDGTFDLAGELAGVEV